jgi:hypothetical protein
MVEVDQVVELRIQMQLGSTDEVDLQAVELRNLAQLDWTDEVEPQMQLPGWAVEIHQTERHSHLVEIMRMRARVIFAEEVEQAVPPSSKLLIESVYVGGDRRHCTMELFELDGELPLMMMVGSVDLLEVQLEGL